MLWHCCCMRKGVAKTALCCHPRMEWLASSGMAVAWSALHLCCLLWCVTWTVRVVQVPELNRSIWIVCVYHSDVWHQ